MGFKKRKILIPALISLTVSPFYPFSTNVHAEGLEASNKFEMYIQEAIQDELALNNMYPEANLLSIPDSDSLLASKTLDPTLQSNISKLANAEVTIVNFDENGDLVSAESSDRGDITEDFIEKEDTTPLEESFKDTQQLDRTSNLSVQAAPSLPSGGFQLQNNTSGDGAFHRLATPASNASTTYTGSVADDVTFPAYDITSANSYGEAGYLYTGFDSATQGYAEVGFGTASSSVGAYPTAWFPLFHGTPKTGAVKEKGPGSSNIGYWYDTSKPYTAGQTVSGYKVYYKTNESFLKIHYLIGYSELYIVNYPNINPSSGIKVKRLTTIGLPLQNPAIPQSTPFHTGWTSSANWGNFRFLTNNGSSTAYPGEIAGISDQTALHGANIYYLKKVNSSSDRDESYWIYK